MQVNARTVHKLLPVAAAFDLSVAVALFGGYIDPTLRIIGFASGVICAVSMGVIWYRNL
jgi:hypothetical protein